MGKKKKQNLPPIKTSNLAEFGNFRAFSKNPEKIRGKSGKNQIVFSRHFVFSEKKELLSLFFLSLFFPGLFFPGLFFPALFSPALFFPSLFFPADCTNSKNLEQWAIFEPGTPRLLVWRPSRLSYLSLVRTRHIFDLLILSTRLAFWKCTK